MTAAWGHRGWLLLALAASIGVLLLMWLPVADPFPEIKLWYEDKWQHMFVYGFLSYLWLRTGLSPFQAAAGVFLWSLMLELGQLLLPYRGFEVLDLVANAAGCVGLAALSAIRRPVAAA